MFQAEIRGKLPEIQNSEDALTSTFFGLMKYAPKDTFFKIIRASRTLDEQEFSGCVPSILSEYTPTFHFWPRLIDEYGEPDIVVVFSGPDKKVSYVLGVEVKLYSSKSGELENDQLKRYYNGIPKTSPFSGHIFIGILYLTNYPSQQEIEDSFNAITKETGESPNRKLFQLRWMEVTKALEEYVNTNKTQDTTLLKDLLGYLRHKNLMEFKGFSFQKEKFTCNIDIVFYQDTGFSGFSLQPNRFDIAQNQKILYG